MGRIVSESTIDRLTVGHCGRLDTDRNEWGITVELPGSASGCDDDNLPILGWAKPQAESAEPQALSHVLFLVFVFLFGVFEEALLGQLDLLVEFARLVGPDDHVPLLADPVLPEIEQGFVEQLHAVLLSGLD
jgi:hypothetical protein